MEQRPGQRQSYTAPVAFLNDVARGSDDYDPFAEHKKPTVAQRESEYQARRRAQMISPARVDFFADGGKTPEVGARGYAEIMREVALKGTEADFRKQMQEKAFDLVRSLKVKQLDLLINVSRRLVDLKRMLKTGEPCIEAVTQLQQLVDQNM